MATRYFAYMSTGPPRVVITAHPNAEQEYSRPTWEAMPISQEGAVRRLRASLSAELAECAERLDACDQWLAILNTERDEWEADQLLATHPEEGTPCPLCVGFHPASQCPERFT